MKGNFRPSLAAGLLLTLIVVSWALSSVDLHPAIKSLWPAVVALGVILISRQAALGLFTGSLAGCFILLGGDFGGAFKGLLVDHLFPSMQGSWRVGAILFTLVLGAFTVVIERGGGFSSLAHRMLSQKKGDPKMRLEAATGLMGIVCFFDGLANSLLVGRITRPLADKVGVARAKMAYIVDSTSSSVACLAFISTWIATQLSLIQQAVEGRGIEESAYELFFSSITQNFYCLFTLILVVVVIWRRWDIGAMKRSSTRACKIAEESLEVGTEPPSDEQVSIWTAILPILVLSVSIIALFYLWETQPVFPVTVKKLTAAFSGSAGPYALTLGSVIGLFAACLLFPKREKENISSAVTDGAASMLSPLLILIMAWTFGSVLSQLGTAQWVAGNISSAVHVNYFPAAIFITGAIVSFVTGSSWGTMALLMPIAIPSYLDLAGDSPELLPAVIGAVFSGAVFGDHCSPFSDTTIVSAFSCGVTPREHVMTQLPYAGITAVVALVIGYGGLAIGLAPVVCILLGAVLLLSAGFLSTRKSHHHKP